MNFPIIPFPDTIPVNWVWFEGLLLLTFFLHMILMNFILGGSLLTVWDLITGKLEKKASASIPTLIALTINFGVPPLLFVQVLYGHLFYSSSLILAVPWIIIIPVLILAYYGAYIFAKNIDKAPKWSLAGLVLSSLILLYIAFMYVNNSTLALTPDRWDVYFERPGGNNLNWGEPTLWPRFLHFLLAALAIGALGRAIFYYFSRVDEEDKTIQIRRNLKIFGWMTLIQFGIGTWFWLTMPEAVWKIFMGKSVFPTVMMSLGWLGALAILHSAFTNRLKMAMFLGGIQVLLMVIIRDMARMAYLENVFHPDQLENVKQLSPFIVFLIVFVIGLLSLYYMIRLMSKPKSQQS